MGTVKQYLEPEAAQFPSSAFAQFDRALGTNFPVSRLLFDAAADEAAFWKLEAVNYGASNPNITCNIEWYAVNATSGVVRWEVAIAAITPESDSQDVETKSLATAQTVDDTHLGTTSKRLHTAAITITNLDSVAPGDEVFVRLRRVGSHANDTMANDAAVTSVRLSYSDT